MEDAGSCHVAVVHPDRRGSHLGRGNDEVDQKTRKNDRFTLLRRRSAGLLPLALALALAVWDATPQGRCYGRSPIALSRRVRW